MDGTVTEIETLRVLEQQVTTHPVSSTTDCTVGI